MSEKKTPGGAKNNAADKRADMESAPTKPDDKRERKPRDTSEYSAADLAGAARATFKVPPEVVQTALKLAGKTDATQEEAEEIVKKFMERKVKR